MDSEQIEQSVTLPLAEAAELATRAAANGVPTTEFLGMHVLRSAFGALHPGAAPLARIESWDVSGQEGAEES